MSLCALCFVPSSFPCRPAPRITKSLVNRRPYSVCRRNTPRAALPPQEEADWIIVDVSLRGLDENARPLASTIQHDGRALVYKALHNQPAELSLVLCSDAEILELNTAWRGKEKPTDVLSFPQNDEVVLGDIVISIDTAARQAAARAMSVEDEVRVLLVHGLLHLMGYDHERSETALQKMASAEQRLMAEMGWLGEGLISSSNQTSYRDSIHETART